MGLGLFALTCETLVRLFEPTHRYQVVRTANLHQVYEFQGIPMWRLSDSGERYMTDCMVKNPDATPIMAFGSSIFYGLRDHEDTFAFLLQVRLGDGYCVMNFAEPGFHLQNKLGRAREMLGSYPKGQVLWEIWENDPFPYVMLDGAAYSLRTLPVDRQGYPATLGLGAPLNGLLFRNSRAWEYAVLAVRAPGNDGSISTVWRREVHPLLEQVHELVVANGSTLTLVFMPEMGRPFTEQMTFRTHYAEVAQWADSKGIRWLNGAALFGDLDPEEVSVDTCCHMNRRGMQILAAGLEPYIEETSGP
jgi:hypothetical protein